MTRSAVAVSSRLADEHRPWLAKLEAVGAPPGGLPLPPAAQAAPTLARLGVDAPAVGEVIAAWPSQVRDAELWWLLERCYHVLVRDLGGFETLGWPAFPPTFGASGRFFYVYVFLAALAEVRVWHRQRGVPDDVSWATLADLGRNISIHRRIHGHAGLDVPNWLTLHFRGSIYELGRLQFNRMRIPFDQPTLDGLGADFHHADPALGIHIPEAGPLSPERCAASLQWARDFFRRHFPETPCRIGVCTSWLLDEQLAAYLDANSNIIRFQRRFHLMPDGSDGDANILAFVFRRIAPSLDDLPQRTTLERAVVSHLRAGGHWRNRSGWLEL